MSVFFQVSLRTREKNASPKDHATDLVRISAAPPTDDVTDEHRSDDRSGPALWHSASAAAAPKHRPLRTSVFVFRVGDQCLPIRARFRILVSSTKHTCRGGWGSTRRTALTRISETLFGLKPEPVTSRYECRPRIAVGRGQHLRPFYGNPLPLRSRKRAWSGRVGSRSRVQAPVLEEIGPAL